ncbi:hypothetical protein SAMN05216298_2277 [Glycomyces sambucus]|uniref:Tetratricopeptide repeat-containing protein n=1 Tax=Glycomyces sambucus TaxID=380244 RepID=A0A1G9GLI2_9ACTN|nr:hypothetical protein [Glycomyces sambucus]SDL01472.1 hypothetical protein SAMN05216298_2277 [Glycomyces sambucus]
MAALESLQWDSANPPEAGTARARLTAQVLMIRSTNLAQMGDAAKGLRLLDSADGFVFHRDRGMLLHQRAFNLWQSGRLSDALQWFAEAEPHLAVNGPDNIYAALFHNRAMVWRDLGELRKGMENIQRAIELYDRIDIPVNRAKARFLRAQLWLDLGEVTKALSELDEVRDQFRVHSPILESYVDGSYGDALLYVGMHRQAAVRWADAIAAHRLAGDRRNAAIYEFWRAVAAFEDRQFTTAGTWAQQAMDSLYEQGNEPMAFLARLLILQGQFDAGEDGPDFAEKVVRLSDALAQRGWTLRLEQARILAARAKIRARDLDGAADLLQGEHSGPGYDALAEGLARYLAKAELAIALDRDPMPELRAGLDLLDEYRTTFGSVEFQAGVSALGIQLASKGLTHTTNHGSPAEMLQWAERCRGQALRIPR